MSDCEKECYVPDQLEKTFALLGAVRFFVLVTATNTGVMKLFGVKLRLILYAYMLYLHTLF